MAVNVVVSMAEGLSSVGRNEKGHETRFDTSVKGGGTDNAASPVEIMLQAACACGVMDVAGMLRKRQKNVVGLTIKASGERRDEEPRIFTKVHFIYRLTSPDATKEELDYCIKLSLDKYCSVSNTIKLAGAEMSYESEVIRGSAMSDVERASTPL
jgi:putative redox protein